MNRRDEVLRAFRFEEVRPVPYTIWYDDDITQRLAEHYGDPDWHSRFHNYILRMTLEWEPKEYLASGHYRDLHGTEWQEGTPRHLVSPALEEPSLQEYEIPNYVSCLTGDHDARVGQVGGILPSLSLENVRARIESEGADVFTVVGYGEGLFARSWMIRGYEEFFSDLILEPGFAHELLDRVLERQLELLDLLLELPCDAIIFSDDYGDQRGVATGPALWRKFVKPGVKKLYEKVHDADKLVFQHSCGNVFDIIPDLMEIGLDCLQSLQAEAMPVYEIKRRYGDRLCLWGGLGTQRLLPFGTPEEIQEEVRRLKKEMGRGGGYVLTSCKPILTEVPTENAVAFIEEVTRE